MAKYKDWPRAQAPQPQTEATERMAEAQPADFPSPPPSPPSVAAAATELEYAKEERPEPLPSRSLAVAPSLTEQVEPAPHAPEASIAPLAPRQELAEGRLQPEIEEPASPPDLSSAEASPSAAPESAEPAIEASPEGGEPESAVLKAEPVEQGTGESGATQKATVRERSRNPRYMRRGRWMARKEGQTEAAPRGSRPKDRETPQPLIADLLKEGQEILVQVAKEPLGKKGARITSHIALPGRYLVYMPTVDHIGVSRKIASDEERKRIILEHSSDIPGGFIVRTAGEGHSEEDFRQDIFYLSRLWAETRAQAEKVSAPALLHHDLNLVLRILRDQFSEEFSAVWVDNEQEYESILSLVSKFQPGLVNRVKLYTKDVPLFDELGINEEITKALKPKVWLKSGGYIVINQTEALVAIDVNTGKFVGKSNRLEDTIVKTNVDAIREIVRQIRLRDLGGIIVVDFIDMDEKKNRQKVMAAMEEALKSDRSPSKLLSFNEFGLVAITRKRVRQSLERTLCQSCTYCGGSGLVKSVVTVCNEILSEARKLASQLDRKQIALRVNPDVGKALKLRGNTILQEIEEITGKTVIIRNDPSLHMENFDFN